MQAHSLNAWQTPDRSAQILVLVSYRLPPLTRAGAGRKPTWPEPPGAQRHWGSFGAAAREGGGGACASMQSACLAGIHGFMGSGVQIAAPLLPALGHGIEMAVVGRASIGTTEP